MSENVFMYTVHTSFSPRILGFPEKLQNNLDSSKLKFPTTWRKANTVTSARNEHDGKLHVLQLCGNGLPTQSLTVCLAEAPATAQMNCVAALVIHWARGTSVPKFGLQPQR